MKDLCFGCMHPLEQGQEVCPRCGYAQNTPAKEAYHLAPGTILVNRFLVGRVLGYGGFGVTYAGYDLTLNQRVAIKEYLPSEFSTRMPGNNSITVYSGEASEQFAAGYKSFMGEAQRLARFNSISGVVAINDIFSANNTSYIAMELLEGVTVKEKIAKEGRISWQETLEIMTVVLETLSAVHKEQIIHRDIAPDNIFITNDGRIKLLDFGAARYATSANSKSLSVILKPGYAPEEQYRSRGEQGAWSDVYAAAATMYRMLTGVVPPESMERMANDTLKPLSKCGVNIPEAQENAIMNALAVDASERTRSAEEFLDELLSGTTTRNMIAKKKRDEGRWPKWLKVAAACVSALLIVVAAAFYLGFFDSITNRATLKEGKALVPSVIKMSVEDASELLTSKGFDVQIVDKQISDRVGQDLVMLQTPATGRIADEGTTVEIIVSAGDVEYDPDEVPDVQYKTIKDAKALFDQLGLTAEISYSFSSTIAKDLVMSQSVPAGTRIGDGMVISLVVSKGKKTYEMPQVVGKSYNDAKAQLESLGASVDISFAFDETVDTGKVISQSVLAGALISEGTKITLVVSKGRDAVVVPTVTGENYLDAKLLLESMGLTVTITFVHNESTSWGIVTAQDTAPDTSVTPPHQIGLTVSKGTSGRVVSAEELNSYSNTTYNISTTTQYRYRSRTRSQITIKNGYSSYSGYTTLPGRTQYGATTYGKWKSSISDAPTSESSGSTYYTVVTLDIEIAYYYWVYQGTAEWMFEDGAGTNPKKVEIYADNRLTSMGVITDEYASTELYGVGLENFTRYTIEVGSYFNEFGADLGEIYVLMRGNTYYDTSAGNFWKNGITMVCSEYTDAETKLIYRQATTRYQYTHVKWGSWSSFGSWSSWADTNNMPSDTDTHEYEFESRTMYIVSGKEPTE